jgi:hypothetical protein
MVIFLVAYVDEQGPYAAAFSSRQDAERFAEAFDGRVIETTVDAHTESSPEDV